MTPSGTTGHDRQNIQKMLSLSYEIRFLTFQAPIRSLVLFEKTQSFLQKVKKAKLRQSTKTLVA